MTLASISASSGLSSSPPLSPSASALSLAASASSAISSADDANATARALRARLLAFENALDDALALGGSFTAELVDARRRLRLSALVGQPALVALAQSLSHVADARGQAVRTHRLLDAVAQALRMDDGSGFGDAGKDPTGLLDGDAIVA
jgi:hypothetical protein